MTKCAVMRLGYSRATLYTTEQNDQLCSLIKDAEESFDVQGDLCLNVPAENEHSSGKLPM